MNAITAFFEPMFFNKLILVLYALNALQFLARRHTGDAWYWGGAFIITAAVTFGNFKR